jgi:hypothetical protein
VKKGNHPSRQWQPGSRRCFLQARIVALALAAVVVVNSPSRSGPAAPPGQTDLSKDKDSRIDIRTIPPDPRGGRAYQLVYTVNVPIDVFWRFKTDFDNDFLQNSPVVTNHRFVSHQGDAVITENQYRSIPGVTFRWQTTLRAKSRRLAFRLLNPEQCDQKFHYGHIQLTPLDGGTRVSHVAYFDFWGAAVWAAFPWKGGMRAFLTETARWERETALRLKNDYAPPSSGNVVQTRFRNTRSPADPWGADGNADRR